MRFVMQMFVVVVLGYLQLTSNGVCGTDDCRAKLDLVIILDSSFSVGLKNFKKVTAFIHSLVGLLPVQQDGVRVSVVRYATDATVISYLNQNTSKQEKLTAIQTMPYKKGATFTHVALSSTRETVLIPERGDRPEVPNLIILATDGVSQNQTLTQAEAAALKENKDLKIFVIGIGRDVADTELVNVASRPEMVYKLTDFSQLSDIVGKLARFSCSDMEERSVSELKHWSSYNETLTSSVGTTSKVSTSLPSRKLLSTTPSLPQTVPSTSYMAPLRQTLRSTLTQLSALINQSKSWQRSSKSMFRSKTEIINTETTFPSNSVATINTTDKPERSTLTYVTEEHHRKTDNNIIVNASVNTPTQGKTTDVLKEFTKSRDTMTPSQSPITSSNKVPISHAITFQTDLTEISTNSDTSTRPESTASSSFHQPNYHSYNHSKVTTPSVGTTSEIANTTPNTSNVTDTKPTEFDVADQSTSETFFPDTNTTIHTISGTVKVKNHTTSQSIAENNFPTSFAANTIVTNLTSAARDVTVVKRQTSTVNTPTSDFPIYPTLVTNKVIDLNSEIVGHHTTSASNETVGHHTTSASKETVGHHTTSASKGTVGHHTISASSETDNYHKTYKTNETVEDPTTSAINKTVEHHTTSASNETVDQHTSASNEATSLLYPNTTWISRVKVQTSTVLPLITRGLLIQNNSTRTSSDKNQTKHTQSTRNSKQSRKSHRTLVFSRSTPPVTEPTRLDSSRIHMVLNTTVVVEFETLGNDSEIDKELNKTSHNDTNIHGDHGGDMSSRDVYIFVAGGSAVAVILTAVSTFMTVLCRRRKGNIAADGEV